MTTKPKLIIVFGSGGHTAQMVRLTELLHHSYDFDVDAESVRLYRPGLSWLIGTWCSQMTLRHSLN